MTLGHETRIMGIINLTPDSFSCDGQLTQSKGKINVAACLGLARRLIREGADILDIGGESTRPGAVVVSEQEEIRRVIPVLRALIPQIKVPVSVDTSKIEVARRALDLGVSIVNNIMTVKASRSFLKMVRDYEAAIVIMHIRKTPATMHAPTKYKDLISDVIKELKISIEKCLEIGIKKDRIIIDPGIGFSKTAEHNFALINRLDELSCLNCPILLGTSRKSFIGQILKKDVNHRLMGTAASVTAGVVRGAHIVRVHDVKAIKETLRVTDAILNTHS
ncbi:MAG: dihydropteroate synthase [Candidatus Omnitrophica bacterium]|nr:dihydropteroate synthase [Candidatus Omnitrophota bacterium]